MTKINFSVLFFALFLFINIASVAIHGQTAYGISIVRGNQTTRIVDGYSGTWLDYVAGYYYDPEVMGQLFRADDTETTLASGRHIGYGDIVPAAGIPLDKQLCRRTNLLHVQPHFIWSYFVNSSNYWWFDPFRYSSLGTGYPPWGGFPYSNYFVIPDRHLRPLRHLLLPRYRVIQHLEVNVKREYT